MNPSVSVVLSVWNGEATLPDALQSVWQQTFRDFELIVVDDASTDRTPEILAQSSDTRLRVLRNDANLGLTRSLNRGLRAARGRYIAHLDADDTCHAERLARQTAFLETHSDVGLLGTAVHVGGEVRTGPLEETELRWWLLFGNVFVHSSVMFRADLLGESGYDEAFACAQDYALWSHLADKTRFAKLAEPLVSLSEHDGQISRHRAAEQTDLATRISCANLSRTLERTIRPEDRAALQAVFPRPETQPNRESLAACRLCLDLFQTFARQNRVNPEKAHELQRTWLLRVLNSLSWGQRGEIRRSGLLGHMMRTDPRTLFWYAWQRMKAKWRNTSSLR